MLMAVVQAVSHHRRFRRAMRQKMAKQPKPRAHTIPASIPMSGPIPQSACTAAAYGGTSGSVTGPFCVCSTRPTYSFTQRAPADVGEACGAAA